MVALGSFQFLIFNRRGVFYPFVTVYAYEWLGASLLQVGLLVNHYNAQNKELFGSLMKFASLSRGRLRTNP